MQLTQKETSLLKDLKMQEKICAEKYQKHAQIACDGQLRTLFTDLASVEQRHYSLLEQIEKGTVPQLSGSTPPECKSFTSTYGIGETPEKASDSYLCNDLLASEKHASSLYDTCIFEFTNHDLRTVLNHIQAEEQHHGKELYDYMSANNIQS